MNKRSAIEVVRSVGWLSRQPLALQDDLLSPCIVQDYAAGDVLVRHGEPYRGVYALANGVLRIDFPMLSGGLQSASVEQPVSWFGYGPSLARGSFHLTVTAVTPVSLLFLPHNQFERLIERAEYCRAFSLLALDHFDRAAKVIAQLLVPDSEIRVASRIVMLAEQAPIPADTCVPITQAELARICGLSRHTVQQVLTRLGKRGLITARYGKIEVPSVDALRRSCRVEAIPT